MGNTTPLTLLTQSMVWKAMRQWTPTWMRNVFIGLIGLLSTILTSRIILLTFMLSSSNLCRQPSTTSSMTGRSLRCSLAQLEDSEADSYPKEKASRCTEWANRLFMTKPKRMSQEANIKFRNLLARGPNSHKKSISKKRYAALLKRVDICQNRHQGRSIILSLRW